MTEIRSFFDKFQAEESAAKSLFQEHNKMTIVGLEPGPC